VIPSEAAHPHRFVGCIGQCKRSGISSCVPPVAPSPLPLRKSPCRCSAAGPQSCTNCLPMQSRAPAGAGQCWVAWAWIARVPPRPRQRTIGASGPGTGGRGTGRRGGGEGRAREEERIPVIVAGWLDTSPDAPSLIHPPQETGVPKVIVSALEKEGREEETNFPPSIEARVRQLTPPS